MLISSMLGNIIRLYTIYYYTIINLILYFSMQGQSLTMSNVVTMINSCPTLTHLNLTGCGHLQTFSLDPNAPNPHIPVSEQVVVFHIKDIIVLF